MRHKLRKIQMLKHVGRHGEKKVVVAYNTVPGEDHMALVIYSDSLPSMLHDEVMKVIESPAGQTAKSLADALFRNIMPDGNNTLGALHKGGFLKKVQTKQVILKPNAKSSVRLDELNDILKKMEAGQEAVDAMAKIDAGRGYADPSKNVGRELGEPKKVAEAAVNTSGVLTDADLANQRLDQATKMELQAKTLLAEAKRLKEEASSLAPKTKAKNVRATKKTAA
jgi:hypothetical protein